MLNIIKMDLYRMFHTTRLYVIWIILAALMLFTTMMTKPVVDGSVQMNATQAEEMINIGMSVEIPVDSGDNVSVLAAFYGNAQAKFLALMITIFTVMFATADVSSGFIKSIGGQVKNRAELVFSKAVVLSLYVIMTMGIAILVQTISNLCVFGYIEFGPARDFIIYAGVQTLLHIALVLVCLMLSLVLRNNLVSMIIVVCVNMNVLTLFYMGIDKMVSGWGVKDFSIAEYTVTGRITLLPMVSETETSVISIVVAVVFGAVATMIAGFVYKKRDV